MDLNGGVNKYNKQEALHNLFRNLSPNHKLEVVTVGRSHFNDISVPIDRMTNLDLGTTGRVFDESSQIGYKYFTYESPPFPWKLALHTNGRERLRKYLHLK